MKIPVNEAIESGEWLLIDIPDENLKFKIRLLEFEKIKAQDLEDIRANVLTADLFDDPADLWIINLELINVGKIEFEDSTPNDYLILSDQDECQFSTLTGLLSLGTVGKRLGLKRFYNQTPLQPKIKAKGAVAFLLPDEDGSEYFISTISGSIKGA